MFAFPYIHGAHDPAADVHNFEFSRCRNAAYGQGGTGRVGRQPQGRFVADSLGIRGNLLKTQEKDDGRREGGIDATAVIGAGIDVGGLKIDHAGRQQRIARHQAVLKRHLIVGHAVEQAQGGFGRPVVVGIVLSQGHVGRVGRIIDDRLKYLVFEELDRPGSAFVGGQQVDQLRIQVGQRNLSIVELGDRRHVSRAENIADLAEQIAVHRLIRKHGVRNIGRIEIHGVGQDQIAHHPRNAVRPRHGRCGRHRVLIGGIPLDGPVQRHGRMPPLRITGHKELLIGIDSILNRILFDRPQHIQCHGGFAGSVHVGMEPFGNAQAQVVGRQGHVAQSGKQHTQGAFARVRRVRGHVQFSPGGAVLIHQARKNFGGIVRNGQQARHGIERAVYGHGGVLYPVILRAILHQRDVELRSDLGFGFAAQQRGGNEVLGKKAVAPNTGKQCEKEVFFHNWQNLERESLWLERPAKVAGWSGTSEWSRKFVFAEFQLFAPGYWPFPHHRTCPSPTAIHFSVTNFSRPKGPRACSFWVEIPISAPSPNSPPSVKRVEALV